MARRRPERERPIAGPVESSRWRRKASDNLNRTGYTLYGEDLYRQRARDLMTQSSGIERYVIGIFGPNFIGSLAMAIDPLKRFYNTQNVVATLLDGDKIVRSRRINTTKGAARTQHWKEVRLYSGYKSNPQGGLFSYQRTGPDRTETTGTVNRGTQPPLYGVINDTTRTSRPDHMTQGEFELFVPKLVSPSRSVAWQTKDYVATNQVGGGLQRIDDHNFTYVRLEGPEFTISQSNIDLYLSQIRARAIATMQKHAPAMMAKAHPNRRNFDLFYQISELRDLKQTLQGTLEIWLTIERTIGINLFRSLMRSDLEWRNADVIRLFESKLGARYGFQTRPLETIDVAAGRAFLTFKFGWESMQRAIMDFLPSPKKTAREINYLVSRIGRDTSFRKTKRFQDEEVILPAMTTGLIHDEGILDSTVRKSGLRHVELRLVCNYTVKFPELDLPRLRKELYLHKLGAYPTPSDIYNLIPWTWLADWFLGAGDYLSLLETMSSNPSVVNYGFITYREDTELTATIRGNLQTNVTRRTDGTVQTYTRMREYQHDGRLKLTYQLRMSLPRLLSSVKTYWDEDPSLSQAAIMSALVASRSGHRRTP